MIILIILTVHTYIVNKETENATEHVVTSYIKYGNSFALRTNLQPICEQLFKFYSSLAWYKAKQPSVVQ